MPYKTTSINEILNEVNSRNIFLPAIQRKYVWNDEQIQKLMDSIMRGYPIGTFLFWKVKETIVEENGYSMYEFIKNFKELNPMNEPAGNLGNSDDGTIEVVLDGQQRLTSLYIALYGSVSRKIKHKRKGIKSNYPKKELYLDLHSGKSDDEDISYKFEFRESATSKDDKRWYLVKDVLKKGAIIPEGLEDDDVAVKNIDLLHKRLVTDKIINYFEVEEGSMDEVLDIFVRINSCGKPLSKNDLIFSTIVSYWDEARDIVDSLLDDINDRGEKFDFDNEFIMRTFLYLIDVPVSLKVEAFKEDSVLEIKENWDAIKKAITDTVELLVEFNFNSENLKSNLAIIPIVYFRYKGGKFEQGNNKAELKKYIIISQVKHIFSSSSDSSLTKIRKALKEAPVKSFDMENLNDLKFTADGRSLRCTAEEIDSWFVERKKGPDTFMLLSLLYPNLKYGQEGFHQDHMHPRSSFEKNKIKDLVLPDGTVIDDKTIDEWCSKRDTLANLQLLAGKDNESKNATPFVEWLNESNNRETVKFLPGDVSYELAHFEEFMEKRQKLMSDKLKEILL